MSQVSPTQQIHRRKSSKDESEATILISPPPDSESTFDLNGYDVPAITPIGAPPPRRNRLSMGPPPISQTGRHTRTYSNTGLSPTSASPMRTTFAVPQTNGNGHYPPLSSPFRSSFSTAQNGHSHGRNRSISAYSPSLPSPLTIPNMEDLQAQALASSALPSSTTLPNMNMGHRPPSLKTTSYSNPERGPVSALPVPSSPLLPNGTPDGPSSATTAAQHKRRHSRMHSRNLSVFFPRPGSLPSTVISEDGDQDEAPVSTIPEAGSSVNVPGTRSFRKGSASNPPLTPLGQGFKFGGQPSAADDDPDSDAPSPTTKGGPAFSKPARRGHHHKHSMSHSFFSFLEPGSNNPAPPSADLLHTQPTPIPQSPWAPMSAFPETSTGTAFVTPRSNGAARPALQQSEDIPVGAAAVGVAQFLLGAYLWVSGQQIGSLSTTGLGYWVVFDAFGVAVGRVAPPWLARAPAVGSSVGAEKEAARKKIRRPYGNGRMETVLMFAQAVYLMFSSVYVCKETVEHLLLSAGGQEGHHHHSGDENPHTGIDFPIIIIFLTFASLLSTAFFYENNSHLVNLSGNRLPTLSTFMRSISGSKRSHNHDAPPTDPLAIVLTNPFVASPLFIAASIILVALFLAPAQHRLADLALAFVIAVLTFQVAYRASVVLGNVLLQTAPTKGMPSGKLESLHRAVREIERHPHVSHLPPPHIWQLTPSLTAHAATALHAGKGAAAPSAVTASGSSSFANDALVVTMDIHVRQDLADDDVLALTKWAWERCVNALGGYKEFRDVGEVGGPEVTVGIVRG
ncbi:hypothetical protein DFP72DRAFT_889488 [Ephemerocybe angulata]|uniref:Cation efflux protein transmembrane domain-containing protein n=1 Tax=Ephemerocybe angulata TaxID=980116 RepID=A0A8H6M6T7_9AGAR|nr:hypothetical protein DFP72DRAFT_889488 [Tulosesus angulatus]